MPRRAPGQSSAAAVAMRRGDEGASGAGRAGRVCGRFAAVGEAVGEAALPKPLQLRRRSGNDAV